MSMSHSTIWHASDGRGRGKQKVTEEGGRVRGCHTFRSHLSVNSFIFHLQHISTALVMLTARGKCAHAEKVGDNSLFLPFQFHSLFYIISSKTKHPFWARNSLASLCVFQNKIELSSSQTQNINLLKTNFKSKMFMRQTDRQTDTLANMQKNLQCVQTD